MIFGQFVLSIEEANAYIIGCTKTREALLIDVGEWDPRMEEFLRRHRLTLAGIFVTHTHYDHVSGLPDALRAHQVPVYSFDGEVLGVPTEKVAQGSTVRFGSFAGRVVETPGHTPDGVSLIFDEPGMVFTGDALFAGSVGGTGTQANAQTQHDAIVAQLFGLPDHFQIHSGHGPATTVGIERRFNPFFN